VTSVTEPRELGINRAGPRRIGAAIEKDGRTVRIHGLAGANGSGKLLAKSLDVPGDLSSAVFLSPLHPCSAIRTCSFTMSG